jgi:RNA polymerase sigma-70 factor (ECF subfamily)
MTTDLISRARADGGAFRELSEPNRRELLVHCYRMLGSLQDAEDALQDTRLAAGKASEGSRDAPRSAHGSTGSSMSATSFAWNRFDC